MRNWTLFSVAAALLVGGAFGWIIRGEPKEVVKVVEKPVQVVAKPPRPRPQLFPDYPKPVFQLPPPEATEVAMGGPSGPPVMVGDLPSLPTAAFGGSAEPLELPNVPETPVVDIRADEATARRLALQAGGDVVSSADARDATGKVGRTLVVEVAPTDLEKLRTALQKALGDRAVLSDGGTSTGTNPSIQKAEADLATIRKSRDKARLDFMPEAPALRQIEEDYLRQEKALAELRKTAVRARLNVLIRPTLPS